MANLKDMGDNPTATIWVALSAFDRCECQQELYVDPWVLLARITVKKVVVPLVLITSSMTNLLREDSELNARNKIDKAPLTV